MSASFQSTTLIERSGVRATKENQRCIGLGSKAGRKVGMSRPSEEVPVIDMEDGIKLAQAVVDTVRDPLLVLDQALRVVAVGRSFCQTFRISSEDVRGHLLYEIDGGQWDIPELRELLATISAGQAVIEDYEVEREFPGIGHRIMMLNARKVFYETGSHSTVLLAFEDITNQRAFEQQVQELLREKDMLLQEIEHRVANSLQIIASILVLKARAAQSEEARAQLEDAHRRVMSVAAVQKHLHVSGGGKPIQIGDYLTKLCKTLAESMIGGSRPISLRVVADAGAAASRDAVSIGLIVTELVMNALKYAFTDGEPGAEINISYRIDGSDWTLTVSDNGKGMPNVTVASEKSGLGTNLVKALTRQLGAVVETVSGPHGTAVAVIHATLKPASAMRGELSRA